jgi:hypothetical protein
MASLQKFVLHEGEGATPKVGDNVSCMFTELTAAGQRIPMYVRSYPPCILILTVSGRHQARLEFPSGGNASTVLRAVIGLQLIHKLSRETLNILEPGFEFFISSLKSMKTGELAEIQNEDIEGAKNSNHDFYL